ncbi:hypothetical protein EKE94_09560 [Mesobaculum littorinae]|uniref:Uncharacterized protein n=1 Tax=Mesobaculum littorinae TaxID=2486419 RepID=A0A438AG91_9RHOB|nr:hypothetical protein [Mesobaculum littorinae]RVV97733.1 hypothetical protein EKE94_09560 [Mesobaculum littorinae]
MSSTDPATLARTFIADEGKDTKPKFWTMNHNRIRPIATKLARVLESDERIAFYRLYLRRTHIAPAVAQGEIPLLIEGYRQLVPHMTGPGPLPFPRLVGLYLFGFDAEGALPAGGLDSAKELKARLKTLTQCGRYINLPAQRAKLERFRSFTPEAPRLLEVLRHADYLGLPAPEGESFKLTDLTFWAMMLIVALAPETRTGLCRDLSDVPPDTPRQRDFLAILHSTLEAVMGDIGPEDSTCRALFDKLAAQQAAQEEAGEAMALARELGLDIAESRDWDIVVRLPEKDSGHDWFNPLSLSLEINPSHRPEWRVQLRHSTKVSYSHFPGKTGLGKDGIPPIDGLRSFPSWLRRLSDVHGLVYDTDAMDVYCGRKQADKKRISDWVLSGGASSSPG